MKKAVPFSINLMLLLISCTNGGEQPQLGARKVDFLNESGFQFKDLNKNGKLDPYEDWRLSPDDRIRNLVSLMTLEEKIGLMFHVNFAVTPEGNIRYDLSDEESGNLKNPELFRGTWLGQTQTAATAKSFIEEKNFRCIINNGIAEPAVFARWSNSMQEIAESSRLGIPILFSSDPRHGVELTAHVKGEQYFTSWPGREGYYGIAASGNLELTRKFGEITAKEFRAVGLHMMLGPQVDLTTEPRWFRNSGSFSESAELTSDLLEAYIDGAQGSSAGPDKILLMLKHWPGSGPHENGEGDWLVYPGDNFDYHIIPFKTGIEKGTLAVMGYYSGTYFDTLGVCFSKYISTDILRDRLSFNGVLCTDWYVIGRKGPLRNDLIGISLKDRYEIAVNAGVDQFGGETVPEPLIELVNEGRISRDRIDVAASRILRWMFSLGLFENPYVNPEAASGIVGCDEHQKIGYQAQLESIILLANNGLLPYPAGLEKPKLYISGIDSLSASVYGNIQIDPVKADLAILKVKAVPGSPSVILSSECEGINIDFPEDITDSIVEIASSGVPTIVAVNLTNSLTVIPERLLKSSASTFMVFDVTDNALLDVIFGKFSPVGKLPFDLPSSMESVCDQLEDVPFDIKDPVFKFSYGLSYK